MQHTFLVCNTQIPGICHYDTLEADGLIGRKAYPEIPPRVEYSLTPRGLSLIPYLEGLVGWALANMPQIMNEREEKVV